MSVVVPCLTCEAKIRIGDEYLGKYIRCPKCNMGVAVMRPLPESEWADSEKLVVFVEAASDDRKAGNTVNVSKPLPSKKDSASTPSPKKSAPRRAASPSNDDFVSDFLIVDDLEFLD